MEIEIIRSNNLNQCQTIALNMYNCCCRFWKYMDLKRMLPFKKYAFLVTTVCLFPFEVLSFFFLQRFRTKSLEAGFFGNLAAQL